MSKWSSSALLPRPVTKIICSIPASRASSTAYWISGRSTIVSISLGIALVAGRKRVPSPATGKTALRTGLSFGCRRLLGCWRRRLVGRPAMSPAAAGRSGRPRAPRSGGAARRRARAGRSAAASSSSLGGRRRAAPSPARPACVWPGAGLQRLAQAAGGRAAGRASETQRASFAHPQHASRAAAIRFCYPAPARCRRSWSGC